MQETGMLLVIVKPSLENAVEFNDWYDTDHTPSRLEIDGIQTARRYREVAPSSAASTYLALYDLDSVAVMSSPAYRKIRENPDARERAVIGAALETSRWVLRQVPLAKESRRTDGGICGTYLQCTYWTPAEGTVQEGTVQEGAAAEAGGWAAGEYVRRAVSVPGVLRVRRFALTEGNGPAFVDIHDLDSEEVLFDQAYDELQAEWADRLGLTADSCRRQLFRLLRRFEPAAGPAGASR